MVIAAGKHAPEAAGAEEFSGTVTYGCITPEATL
jgi:hypothetical protein